MENKDLSSQETLKQVYVWFVSPSPCGFTELKFKSKRKKRKKQLM